MPTWVCLLRGINLGAHNRVSMPDLRDALERRGHRDVQTHLQSGNVVLRTRHRSEAGVAEHVAQVLDEDLGLDVPVVARSPDDLRAVVDAMPFAAPDPVLTHVVLLAGDPDPEGVQALGQLDASPDRLAVVGREVFVNYAVSSGTSRITLDRITRPLCVDGTARNWRTVTTVADLAAAAVD